MRLIHPTNDFDSPFLEPYPKPNITFTFLFSVDFAPVLVYLHGEYVSVQLNGGFLPYKTLCMYVCMYVWSSIVIKCGSAVFIVSCQSC